MGTRLDVGDQVQLELTGADELGVQLSAPLVYSARAGRYTITWLLPEWEPVAHVAERITYRGEEVLTIEGRRVLGKATAVPMQPGDALQLVWRNAHATQVRVRDGTRAVPGWRLVVLPCGGHTVGESPRAAPPTPSC